MLNLYEVTNGYIGESYTRVYVWQTDEISALEDAKEAFKKNNEGRISKYSEDYFNDLRIEKLFSSTDEPFCTRPSDCGFDLDKD